MISITKRKLIRFIKRQLKNKRLVLVLAVTTLLVGTFAYTEYMQNRRLTVDPSTYSQLLDLIAKVESRGNYNAHFGNARNTSINFTTMPIKEVMQWQTDFVQRGNPSSAVGKYQIISTTLNGLVNELGVDTNQLFDKTMQDRMAVTLIERRGAEAYVNNELTKEEFAANLAKEWASLPKVIGERPNESYYASDGLNKSLVSIKEVLKAIEPISAG